LTARAALVLVLTGAALAAPVPPTSEARARRLAVVQKELVRLRTEMESLGARERGVLGDVARLDAAIALDEAKLEAATLELRATEDGLAASQQRLSLLEEAQARRAPYLAGRLRELYKRGDAGLLARALAPVGSVDARDGIRYGALLARRDAAQLTAWRRDAAALRDERSSLARAAARLAEEKDSAARSKTTLETSRADRSRLLDRIRDDRERHAQAIGELDGAARELASLVDQVGEKAPPAALDVRKFRGLLDWPAQGQVTAGFGKSIHPRFKTEVPHPGLDIDAGDGAPFRAVFDGRVAYAAPLHGYGLTVVVDHGHGVVSVYAHAGVLLAETGQDVTRGQELGKVGDSGSLRGPYLYFELRVAGKPADPTSWLRSR
jgi:septal ring factor EnvC (AmiA/AmiB activator)